MCWHPRRPTRAGCWSAVPSWPGSSRPLPPWPTLSLIHISDILIPCLKVIVGQELGFCVRSALTLGDAPVSYTHLDVYKRQIVTNGDDMGELKMLAEGDVLAGTPLFKF